jgi:drug/metabolite transporter, DME family
MVLGVKLIGEQDPWAILFWRSLGMLPVLLAILWLRSQLGALVRVSLPILIAAPALAYCFASAILAVQATTAANAVFPLAVTPLISALLGWAILGERVRPATWAAILLAAVGLAVMVGEGAVSGDLVGTLIALSSAASFALFTVCLRWAGARDSVPATVWGALVAVAAGATMAGGPAGVVLPLRETLIALALGMVVLGFGLFLFGLGTSRLPASEASLLAMTEVLLSPVWVWLVLGETSTATTLSGAAVVVVALVFNAVSGARAAPQPATDRPAL